MAKIKIIANKVVLDVPTMRKKFDDFNLLVKYVNEKGITISNPSELPPNFQKQLKQNVNAK